MEIKNVKKEEIGYPKMNEISNKKLKKCIPDKWIKLGVTSLIFEFIINNKVFADTLIINNDIAGALPYYNPIYNYVRGGCNIVSLISALTFLISAIMIIIKKSRTKKQGENIKVSKKIKIVFIISIILLVLSRLGYIVINFLEY